MKNIKKIFDFTFKYMNKKWVTWCARIYLSVYYWEYGLIWEHTMFQVCHLLFLGYAFVNEKFAGEDFEQSLYSTVRCNPSSFNCGINSKFIFFTDWIRFVWSMCGDSIKILVLSDMFLKHHKIFFFRSE